MLVSFTGVKPVYYELVIVAASAATEIWLGDDGGHFVQKEIGPSGRVCWPEITRWSLG